MVGAFMQGAFLLVIISWYSKGMLNLINEYYRTEFQKHITTSEDVKAPASVEDEIAILLRQAVERVETQESSLGDSKLVGEICPIDHELNVCVNVTELDRFMELMLSVCLNKWADMSESSGIGDIKSQGCQENIVI